MAGVSDRFTRMFFLANYTTFIIIKRSNQSYHAAQLYFSRFNIDFNLRTKYSQCRVISGAVFHDAVFDRNPDVRLGNVIGAVHQSKLAAVLGVCSGVERYWLGNALHEHHRLDLLQRHHCLGYLLLRKVDHVGVTLGKMSRGVRGKMFATLKHMHKYFQ